MLVRISLLLAMLAGVSPATALERVIASEYTCDAIASLINRKGELLVVTGPGTYQRAVNRAGSCSVGETNVPLVSPTKDRPSCLIGYYCGGHPGQPKG